MASIDECAIHGDPKDGPRKAKKPTVAFMEMGLVEIGATEEVATGAAD
jgi:hypothetical protein